MLHTLWNELEPELETEINYFLTSLFLDHGISTFESGTFLAGRGGGIRNQTQNLIHDEQVLYHWTMYMALNISEALIL